MRTLYSFYPSRILVTINHFYLLSIGPLLGFWINNPPKPELRDWNFSFALFFLSIQGKLLLLRVSLLLLAINGYWRNYYHQYHVDQIRICIAFDTHIIILANFFFLTFTYFNLNFEYKLINPYLIGKQFCRENINRFFFFSWWWLVNCFGWIHYKNLIYFFGKLIVGVRLG